MSSQRRLTVIYVVLLGVTVLGFFLIRTIGEARMPAAPAAASFGAHASAPHFDILLHVLLGLAVVIVSARVLGLLFKHFGQPPVIGEVIAGILLGPSFLRHVAPGAAAYLMPTTVSQYFGVLAQIGVILYMFLVGLEVDTAGLRKGTQATIAISHASISVPFLLGAALALLIYPAFSTPRCAVHRVRAGHGRVHVGHGVSRARPDPDGPAPAQDEAGRHRAHVCRGG
jgi:hypothetical protein